MSDEDTDKSNSDTVDQKLITNPIPSTSKNLIESGKSFMASSNIPIKSSETIVRAEATSSGIKSKKASLDKAYLCGKCLRYSSDTIAMVRSHQTAAHPNVVCEVLKRNIYNETQPNKSTTKPLPDAKAVKNLIQPDFINYVCYHCIYQSQFPLTMYRHWKENHKHPKITTTNIEVPSRPFWFRIQKLFQCFYCRRCSHFKDLIVHCQKYHPTFAITDTMIPKKCPLCPYEFVNMNVVDHFEKCHKDTDSSPELGDYMTDEILDEITSSLPREQVKCTHPRCNVIFFSMAELYDHTNEKHTGSAMQFQSIPNDPITYGCGNCPATSTSEWSMVDHIRNHFIQYQCKFCEKRFDSLDKLRIHHDVQHNKKDETFRIVDANENLDGYLAMKMYFPNGFVCSRSDIKRTKYGDMEDTKKWITEMYVKELDAVEKRQTEKMRAEERRRDEERKEKELAEARRRDEEKKEKEFKHLIVKKKNLKRFRISDSDEDSDDSLPRTPTRSAIALRKKRKVSESPSSRASGSKLRSQSKVQTIRDSSTSDNEPLQNLISNTVPGSHYGKKPQEVDLTKIFMDMPIGKNGKRQISCARYALLFNIHPKLRLKRCD